MDLLIYLSYLLRCLPERDFCKISQCTSRKKTKYIKKIFTIKVISRLLFTAMFWRDIFIPFLQIYINLAC